MKKKQITVAVFTGRSVIKVRGTLEPMPSQKLKAGIERWKKDRQGTFDPTDEAKYAKVKLFHAGRKWWLYYGERHPTGHFKSRKEAVAWFEGGGR